jgi:hypothetical protein
MLGDMVSREILIILMIIQVIRENDNLNLIVLIIPIEIINS